MLVVLSDLHLTDGTSCETLDPGAFQIFCERLQDLAVRASWRSDGRYEPIPSIDIVLLGDVFDVMRSSRWLIDGPKPWLTQPNQEFADRVQAIVSGIVQRNSATTSILKGLSQRQTIRVPGGTSSGKPAYEDRLQAVPVRLHYMVGDVDWPLHLPTPEMNRVRRKIIDALGLANTDGVPFPHEPREDAHLNLTLRQHRVFARHGDAFDNLSFSGHRDRASLNDLLLVEGLMPFRFELQHGLAEQLPASAQLGIQELDHVRPLVMAPLCLRQMMQVSCPVTSLQFEIKNCWDRTVDKLMPLIHQVDRFQSLGIRNLDALDSLLKFREQDDEQWGTRMLDWLRHQALGKSNSLSKFAMDEAEFRNRRAKHIVFGHTHMDETVPLDASFADGYVLSQLYFNSGTWRRVYMPTRGTDGWREFLPAEKMTYLTFYRDDERQGAPYEVWNGVLGTAPSPIRRIRIDAPHGIAAPMARPFFDEESRPEKKSTTRGGHSIPAPPPLVPEHRAKTVRISSDSVRP
ncbi:hypothetical protein DTL42_14750 [Bremerella cremea]|uniref:Calcineurin-like phosphoesterase domain-containing protein n=1 Tax=Bremerella cremea TaxID=1031537 RepID=A0A368KQ79_9BACT|nr:hypothetical protein [Bremerella cremea]RCS47771.1 hypothetical protein DTL42_14750 [Bremerella cremea]